MLFDVIDIKRSFAFIEKDGYVSCYQGKVHLLSELDEIHELSHRTERDVVFALPYRIIRERGFEAKGEEPILAMEVELSLTIPVGLLIKELPGTAIDLSTDIQSSLSDSEYASLVRNFITNEIEVGNASQTTLTRRFTGKISDFSIQMILSIYRKTVQQTGQYMTVLFANIDPSNSSSNQFIVGATPERHLEITGNETIMIPIAGTIRKEDRVSFKERLLDFLSDEKEINELFQVVDEEMKIMGVICPDGGEIEGPFLREIGAVIHSEYRLVGKRGTNSIEALRRTLHAPTVVGSPMESAARIINHYEAEPRRYYAGEIGIYKKSRTELPNGDIDCAILIRCAEFTSDGTFRVQAGGGLVRDSDPDNEAKESRAKAMGILGILTGSLEPKVKYLTDDIYREIEPLLKSRNNKLSEFWMKRQNPYAKGALLHDNLKVTILNNEDDFAYMIGHMLKIMQAQVTVVDSLMFDASHDKSNIVVIGPGPGDPNNLDHPRMRRLQTLITEYMKIRKPLLGICLGHQALAVNKGIDVERQPQSSQGLQREVKVMGDLYRLGFYNSFSPVFNSSAKNKTNISYDLDDNNRIIAMRGDHFIGYQFHPESIMSEHGAGLMHRAMKLLSNQ